jgi:hypothetical protein
MSMVEACGATSPEGDKQQMGVFQQPVNGKRIHWDIENRNYPMTAEASTLLSAGLKRLKV